MRKTHFKRIITLLLCFILASGNLSTIPVNAYDDYTTSSESEITNDFGETDPEPVTEPEPEQQEETQEEEQEPEQKEEETVTQTPVQEDTEISTEPAETEIIKKLITSKENISFGTITEGERAEPITFQIQNKGNQKTKFKWVQTDVKNAFKLAISSDTIDVDGNAECTVSLRNDIPAGDYTATLLFKDIDSPDNAVAVTVSVKIKEMAVPEPEKISTEAPKENTEPEVIENPVTEDEKKTKETDDTEIKKEETPTTAQRDQSSDRKQTTEESTQKPSVDPDPVSSEKGTFVIRARVKPENGGRVSGTGKFTEGEDTLLTAYTRDGYEFCGWYQNGTLIEKADSVFIHNIHSDAEYTARFKNVFYRVKVRSSNEDYGTVSGGGKYEENSTVKLRAYPEDGYVFAGWYEDGIRIAKSEKFSIKKLQEDRDIRAVFKREKHRVSMSCYPVYAGEVTGDGKYKDGDDVLITAKAKKGYVFRGFILNNQVVSLKDKYTIRDVDRDLAVTAYFQKESDKQYEIVSGVANKGGMISPSGKLYAGEGSSITYTVAPDNGYAVQKVYIDGKPVETKTHYTFKNIKASHSISVVFAPKKGNEKKVKKDKVITVEEAKKYATSELYPALKSDEKHASNIITPSMYKIMKEEGRLDEILLPQEQNIVGVDAEGLSEEVDDYNYDSATGIYQDLDINPDKATEMIEKGKDQDLVKASYDRGFLNVLINNQYLIPKKEAEVNDIFEDDKTINDMFAFINGVLTPEEKTELFSGREYSINIGIVKGNDLPDEQKTAMEASGAKIDEYFFISVSKQRENDDPVEVTKLQKPIQITMNKPKGTKADCIVHYHDGNVEILDDIDKSEETITIETSTFSPYAFAQKAEKAGLPPMVYVGGSLLLLFAVLAFVLKQKDNTRKE